ncbi:hypothetical protein [Picosynechococcus sp. NKBG15041c]|uniref:hypothetical protein n=1 Tax=Picosynechococcus sp. NKBG15041c TaxID=1407650 RepID=UPI00130E8533|nr:hypothetical protein [Picosynechococcus sp. NKBG15041c]
MVLPVYGETCRTYENQEICLISLKRSAKYYWEYRAVLRIDGKKLPMKKFDCLHDLALANNQRKFVCSLVSKL